MSAPNELSPIETQLRRPYIAPTTPVPSGMVRVIHRDYTEWVPVNQPIATTPSPYREPPFAKN